MLDQDRQDALLKYFLSAFYSGSMNQWPTCHINYMLYQFQGRINHYRSSKMWIYHLFVFWAQQNRSKFFLMTILSMTLIDFSWRRRSERSSSFSQGCFWFQYRNITAHVFVISFCSSLFCSSFYKLQNWHPAKRIEKSSSSNRTTIALWIFNNNSA